MAKRKKKEKTKSWKLSAQDEALLRKNLDEETRLSNAHSALRIEFLEREKRLLDTLQRLQTDRQNLVRTFAKQYDVPAQGWLLDISTMTWQPDPNTAPPPPPDEEPEDKSEE